DGLDGLGKGPDSMPEASSDPPAGHASAHALRTSLFSAVRGCLTGNLIMCPAIRLGCRGQEHLYLAVHLHLVEFATTKVGDPDRLGREARLWTPGPCPRRTSTVRIPHLVLFDRPHSLPA